MNEKRKLKELEKGDSQKGETGQHVEQKNWRQAGAPGTHLKTSKRKKKIRHMYAGKEQFREKI